MCYFPKQWKHATVTLFPKWQRPELSSNQPIKIFERVIVSTVISLLKTSFRTINLDLGLQLHLLDAGLL
jgi:hypothetical protein